MSTLRQIATAAQAAPGSGPTLQFEAGMLFGSTYTQPGRRVTLRVATSLH